MTGYIRARSTEPPKRYLLNPIGRARAGKVKALQYAHVIEGKLLTTAQVAEILGISHNAAYERIKCRQHPLTWASLMQRRAK